MDISAISHEIRNPFTLIYSTLQLLEAERPDLVTCAHWKNLRQDMEYMKQLLEELSSYNNGDRLNLTLTDTNSFLKTLVLSFASSLIDTDIEFVSEILPGLPAVSIDSVKMRQSLKSPAKCQRRRFFHFLPGRNDSVCRPPCGYIRWFSYNFRFR